MTTWDLNAKLETLPLIFDPHPSDAEFASVVIVRHDGLSDFNALRYRRRDHDAMLFAFDPPVFGSKTQIIWREKTRLHAGIPITKACWGFQGPV